MRLFIGIPMAAAMIEELAALSTRLRTANDGLRWTSSSSWHITLQFLGSVRPDQYDCIVSRVREVQSPPVSIQVEGLSFFDRAGVFIVRVRPAPELLLLQQRVIASTQPCGFLPELRPYQPHITLARTKAKPSGAVLQNLKRRLGREPDFTAFPAHEFLLFESFLSASGSRYEIRERFRLDVH
jgi:2'-5' RNA ligase